MDISRLAKMSCNRYWVERAIEDAKGVGSHSKTTKHHSGGAGTTTLRCHFWRMLAVLMMQLELKVKADMLTLQDVKDILEAIMPKNEVGEVEIIKIIKAQSQAFS
jgi:hypothetical protein